MILSDLAAEEAVKAWLLREVPTSPLHIWLVDHTPVDAPLDELDKRLRDIGAIVWKLKPLEQLEVLDRFTRRIGRRLPRRPAHKAFNEGIAAEKERRRQRDGQSAVEEGAEGASKDRETGDATRAKVVLVDQMGSIDRQHLDGSSECIATWSPVLIRRAVPRESGRPERLVLRVLAQNLDVLAEEWPVPTAAWAGKKAFISAFPNVRMQWLGTDDDVQALQAMLTSGGISAVPAVHVTETLGYHVVPGDGSEEERRRFVHPDVTLDRRGPMATPDIVYLSESGGSAVVHMLRRKETWSIDRAREVARATLPELGRLHEPAAMLGASSWFMASVFRPRLLDKLGGFPILAVDGEPSSGKTALMARVCLPFFAGLQASMLLSCSETPFALLKDLSATNAIACVLDEYKPHELQKTIDFLRRLLKRAYTGDVESRGRADQGTNDYTLSTPVVVVGESQLDDDRATADRTLPIEFSLGWLMQHEASREAFVKLNDMALREVGLLIHAWSLSADFDAMLERARSAAGDELERLKRTAVTSPRARNNLVAIYFGREALAAFAASVGAELPATFSVEGMRATVDMVLGKLYGRDEDGEGGIQTNSVDPFDQFVRACSHAASAGIIAEGEDYCFVEGKFFLAVNNAYRKLQIDARSRGETFTFAGAAALMRIARRKLVTTLGASKSYILKVGHRSHLGDDRYVRGVMIAHEVMLDAVPGVEGFPYKTNRSHGGDRMTPKLPWKPWKPGGDSGGDDGTN